MNILGIHGGVTVNQHDAAGALLVDGKLVSCVEEERLIRAKTATGSSRSSALMRVFRRLGWGVLKYKVQHITFR